MWNFVWKLIAPFSMPLIIAGVAAVSLSGMGLYDRWIDDPAVRREARRDYVQLSEKKAVEAQLAEAFRQADIAQSALVANAKRVTQLEKNRVIFEAQANKDRADYEAKLEALGRICTLDSADIEWLLRNPRPVK